MKKFDILNTNHWNSKLKKYPTDYRINETCKLAYINFCDFIFLDILYFL